MPATYVETLTNPRDSLPNAYNGVNAREEDFISTFGKSWAALQDIMGISRPIPKAPGTRLVAYNTGIALESGAVGAGNVIPYSKATVTAALESDITIEKYAKATPIEDVSKYGAAVAIERTDEAFRTELRNRVLSAFYSFANTGAMTGVVTTWQMALAMAKGAVVDKYNKAGLALSDVVAFVNVLDLYEYLGAASISVQTAFGLSYVENFMGYRAVFLLSDPNVPRGRVIATAVENVVLYYVDPADSEFARLGLVYATDPDMPLIGFHAQGNYGTAVGEVFALMGMALWAEYIDGIAVVDVVASGSLGAITGVSSAAGAAAGDSVLTLPDHSVAGGKYYIKTANSTAPAAPTYGAIFDPTGYTEVEDGDTISTTNSYKYRLVEVNGFGQAIADANGTITAKT